METEFIDDFLQILESFDNEELPFSILDFASDINSYAGNIPSYENGDFSFELTIPDNTQERAVVKKDSVNNTRKRVHKTKREIQPKISRAILKNDIRRFYPNMFANIFNNQRFDLITNFFDKYFHPDFIHEQKTEKFDDDETVLSNNNCEQFLLCNVGSFQMTGKRNVALLWYLRLVNVPDAIAAVNNIQTVCRPDGTSFSKSLLTVNGTMIYDMNPDSVTKTLIHKFNSTENSSSMDSNENYTIEDEKSMDSQPNHIDVGDEQLNRIEQEFATTNSLHNYNSDFSNIFPLRPRKLTVTGSITFHMDVNKYIKKMECVAEMHHSSLNGSF